MVLVYVGTYLEIFVGFIQVGITALANLTARSIQCNKPRTFFSLEEVGGSEVEGVNLQHP